MGTQSKKDIGLDIIRRHYTNAKVDEQWSLWHDTGFTWWGHRLAQRIWRERPFTEAGDEIWIVRAETDVARGVSASDSAYSQLAQINATGSMSSLVLDPKAGMLKLYCSMPIIPDFAPAAGEVFSWAAAIQAASAEKAAGSNLLQQFGGTAAVSAHPTSGSRPEPDDMLNVIANAVVPLGRSGSMPTDEAFRLIKNLPNSPSVATNYDTDGLVGEFPFPEAGESAGASEVLPPTALLKISLEPHPIHGPGWWVRLFLPLTLEDAPAARLCNEMNLFETTARAYLYGLGSWCLARTSGSPDLHLCHSTFLPAVVCRSPWLLVNLFMNKYVRLQIVQKQFNLKPPPGLTASQIEEVLAALTKAAEGKLDRKR